MKHEYGACCRDAMVAESVCTFCSHIEIRISIACGMFSQQLDTGSLRCSYLDNETIPLF